MTGMPFLMPVLGLLSSLILAGTAAAQTPQPFPRQPARPAAPQAAAPAPAPASNVTQAVPVSQAIDPAAPTAAQLGIFIPATAQFVASYDAGRGHLEPGRVEDLRADVRVDADELERRQLHDAPHRLVRNTG